MQDRPEEGSDVDAHVDDSLDPTTESPTTGHPVVDRVVSGLGDLEDRPVHDHVAVFEEAHAALRRALDHVDAG